MENNFGNILKAIRTEKGIGQVELAKAINISKGLISLWENGLREPKMTNLVALSKYLNVSLEVLTGMSDY